VSGEIRNFRVNDAVSGICPAAAKHPVGEILVGSQRKYEAAFFAAA